MKKNRLAVLLLLVCSATVFFIGWIQFSVPAGKYGVLVSKTGGVDPDPVLPARFRWQWERLIPTNTELFVFDLVPVGSSRPDRSIAACSKEIPTFHGKSP